MTTPTLALREWGGGRDLPLLVLGPSLGTSTILWETCAPLLRERYRLLAWDLPGHGAAPAATDPFTVAELADAVAAAVDAIEGTVDGEPFLYAGVSLGGATGLELLLRHGSRVRAAAIIASGAQLGEPLAWRERAAKVRAESTSSILIASAERWFAEGSMAAHPDLTGRLLHALQDADDESYALCCEALAAYDVRAELGAVTAPVLALWGRHDAVAPEPKAVEIAEGVAHGQSAVIEGAAHLPPAEQPGTTAAALIGLFDRHAARPHSEGASS
ncbi:alpha/beta hydrolase [Subtercola boreus]|uniref:Alpha/beta hydrolase n=1 Tax=Subtercola boreus TaxID=120213 RepID=A0A3E0VEQ6_9MICO|nr:alpha/beta fold hydrolase [Subtercola boreus]RFA08149.1 alpha/beta hydrolase [Subtercola boreus]TQL54961.1 3-oxoadipate enol-lactonase [Subtercola boreus]